MERKYFEEYKLFLKQWGEDTQIAICIEELGGLTKELCKYNRFKKYENVDPEKLERIKQNIIEECADTLIVVEQMALFFGADEVDKVREQKIQRCLKRISEENDK